MNEDVRHKAKALGFLLMLGIPLLGPAGHFLGAWWLSPAVVFVGVPLGDSVIGEDHTNSQERERRWARYFWAVPHLYMVCWLATLAWSARQLQHGASGWDACGIVLAAGIGSAFATCAAHELLHRPGRFDQYVSRMAMAMCAYGHFVVEHLHHHATVGRIECGTVPKAGESVWHFVPRNIAFGFRNSFKISERMRQARAQGWWANRAIQQHALTLILAGACSAAWGAAGAALFAAQALVAVVTVELVQYCEHYGLTRSADAPIAERLSWNSNGWLTNAITLNITRHSDHHCNASRPYQALQAVRTAPTTKAGYFGLTWLALAPPLWRRVIDPVRARHDQ